ncbi:MAG: hypothetical protein ACTHJH_11095 [Marmoricola sp.]
MTALDTSRARVTQCALSRICGACGESLGRPIALLGTVEEQQRNAFHAPPLHLGCARRLQGSAPGLDVLVTTSGFEFERPGRDDLDRRVRLLPNSLLSAGTATTP